MRNYHLGIPCNKYLTVIVPKKILLSLHISEIIIKVLLVLLALWLQLGFPAMASAPLSS